MMRKIILISILLSSFECYSQNSKPKMGRSDSILVVKIKSTNPNKFLQQTFNEYLSDDFLKSYKEWFPVDEPPGKLFAIILSYSEEVWVEIIFTDILHQKKFSEKRKWNFSLLKKEKIASIKYSWED